MRELSLFLSFWARTNLPRFLSKITLPEMVLVLTGCKELIALACFSFRCASSSSKFLFLVMSLPSKDGLQLCLKFIKFWRSLSILLWSRSSWLSSGLFSKNFLRNYLVLFDLVILKLYLDFGNGFMTYVYSAAIYTTLSWPSYTIKLVLDLVSSLSKGDGSRIWATGIWNDCCPNSVLIIVGFLNPLAVLGFFLMIIGYLMSTLVFLTGSLFCVGLLLILRIDILVPKRGVFVRPCAYSVVFIGLICLVLNAGVLIPFC